MATKKTRDPINSIDDKLLKVNESFVINMYDNGFMIEVDGRDFIDDSRTAKIMVPTIEELLTIVRQVCEMERDN